MAAILPAGRLVFGMQLPIQSQSTIYVEPWEAEAGADELAAVVRAAEASGFHYVAVCDHVAIPRPLDQRMGTTWWDTVATLGWLAGITTRVRLLSHVYVPAYRHPLTVAKAFATLDTVSGGRVVMGVGAGHVEAEFDVLGVPFASRGALLDEAIDALRTAFADEFPTIDGPTWKADGYGQRPRPVQPGGPPIWVGGSSKAAMRRAAVRGDGWLPQGPVDRQIVDGIRRIRAEAGQPEAFDLGALVGSVYVGTPPWDLGGPALTGSPEQVADGLRWLRDLEISQAQVRLRSRSATELVDQIQAFGTQVAPLVTG
jgi:probable F420-dependent oxidoreductase